VRTLKHSDCLELVSRVIGVTGSAIGVSWGVRWVLRFGDPFGPEGRLQLLFSFVVTVAFLRTWDRYSSRWFWWADAAVLSALWAWRCSFKNFLAGFAVFSTAAGLAMLGLLVSFWRRPAARDRVGADRAATGR
jgi:hypothetical protein